MSSTKPEFLHSGLTADVIAAAFEVHNMLGCGLLEKVYEGAFARELELRGHRASCQQEYTVRYKDKVVGTYYADLVVDDSVLVEVKAVDDLNDNHRAQLLNYLRISGIRVGLLINFARPRLRHERFVV